MPELVITHIHWDTEGQDIDDCLLPRSVFLTNAPEDWDQEVYKDEIGELLSDVFGFLHDGYVIQVYQAPVPGEPGTAINVNAVLPAPVSNYHVVTGKPENPRPEGRGGCQC